MSRRLGEGGWSVPRVHGAWISFPPPPPLFSGFSCRSFLFQSFHGLSFFLRLTVSVDVMHHEWCVCSVSTVFRLIQCGRGGKRLNFHVSRRVARLGWEAPVYFALFALSTCGAVVSSCFWDTCLVAHVRVSVCTSIFSKRSHRE